MENVTKKSKNLPKRSSWNGKAYDAFLRKKNEAELAGVEQMLKHPSSWEEIDRTLEARFRNRGIPNPNVKNNF